MSSQWALIKFQASAWPATFLATKPMVARASCGGILSSSKVYSRYLQDDSDSQTGPYLVWIFIRTLCRLWSWIPAHLLSSQIFVVQARALPRLSLSDVSLELWCLFQANSHSFSPPAAKAWQYINSLRLEWMLDNMVKHKYGGELLQLIFSPLDVGFNWPASCSQWDKRILYWHGL